MTDQQPRTLADMTPEERDECIGMWCDVPEWDTPAVLMGEFTNDDGERVAVIIRPAWGVDCPFISDVTPRPNLPRAWNPGGTPVVADPEEYTADGRSRVYFEGIEKVAFPPGTKVRRWVSDWEEA